jgi:hypothetical protein
MIPLLMEAGAQQAEMEAALPLSESAAAAETGAPKLFFIAVVTSAVAGGAAIPLEIVAAGTQILIHSLGFYKFRPRLNRHILFPTNNELSI